MTPMAGRLGRALMGATGRVAVATAPRPVGLLAGGLVLSLMTWEVRDVVPEVGFDDSWRIALNLAVADGLHFGRDVVFTYGPLGFLSQPLIVARGTYATAIAFALVAQVALAAVIFARAASLYGRLCGFALAFVVLALALAVSDCLVYLGFFAAVWALEQDDPPRWWWVPPTCGAVAAVQLLIKLNGGVLCLVLFALVVWRFPPGGVGAELLLTLSFVCSLVVVWLATGSPIGSLPVWLWDGGHVLVGYSNAVASEAAGRRWIWIAATCLAMGLVILLVPRVRSLPRSRAVVLVLVVAAYVYSYVKEGFVREDAHALYFFAALAAAFLAFSWRGRARWAVAALILAAAVATIATPDASLRQLYDPVARLRVAASDVADALDSARRHGRLSAARARARSELAIPDDDQRLLRGHAVDVVPYEASVAWAYGYRWRPEPLLQWYTAFDAHLDSLNASALAMHGAERVLRQRTPTIDAKVPEFEAPATYLALVCHYRELRADGSWEVLARTADRCGKPRLLVSVVAHADQPIFLPRVGRADRLVYARIRFPHSLTGVLESILLKPWPLPTIQLGATFRFLPATAAGPLVLRMPVSGGFSPLFGGATTHPWFELSHVPSPVAVDFYALRYRASAHRPLLSRAPPGRLARTIASVGGRRYRIRSGSFAGWVDAAAPSGRRGFVAGWAVDPSTRHPAPLVAAYVDGRLAALATPAESRPDVAQGLRVPAYTTSGYSLTFPIPPGRAYVRIFALGRGVATELNYPAGYTWR